MTNKDKRKKILKRLSKLRRLERKDKKKKRTKNRSSSRNSLYQEYAYQKKNKNTSYLLIILILVLLGAVGAIVYFFIIKPKLDKKEKQKCTKNEKNDCQNNEYLDNEKCECLTCEVPNPECGPDDYYDPDNLPYCRNSTKYTTDKDGNKKKMYSCQPCPTCPEDGKKVNQCGGGKYDIKKKILKDACYRPQHDNNINKNTGLSPGAIAGIVISIIVILVGVGIFIYYKTKYVKKARKRSLNGQLNEIQTLFKRPVLVGHIGPKNNTSNRNTRKAKHKAKIQEKRAKQGYNLVIKEMKNKREEAAATKIQALFRGKQNRNLVRDAKKETMKLYSKQKAKNLRTELRQLKKDLRKERKEQRFSEYMKNNYYRNQINQKKKPITSTVGIVNYFKSRIGTGTKFRTLKPKTNPNNTNPGIENNNVN